MGGWESAMHLTEELRKANQALGIAVREIEKKNVEIRRLQAETVQIKTQQAVKNATPFVEPGSSILQGTDSANHNLNYANRQYQAAEMRNTPI